MQDWHLSDWVSKIFSPWHDSSAPIAACTRLRNSLSLAKAPSTSAMRDTGAGTGAGADDGADAGVTSAASCLCCLLNAVKAISGVESAWASVSKTRRSWVAISQGLALGP